MKPFSTVAYHVKHFSLFIVHIYIIIYMSS